MIWYQVWTGAWWDQVWPNLAAQVIIWMPGIPAFMVHHKLIKRHITKMTKGDEK